MGTEPPAILGIEAVAKTEPGPGDPGYLELGDLPKPVRRRIRNLVARWMKDPALFREAAKREMYTQAAKLAEMARYAKTQEEAAAASAAYRKAVADVIAAFTPRAK